MNIQDKYNYLIANQTRNYFVTDKEKASAISYQAIINTKLSDNKEDMSIQEEDHIIGSVSFNHDSDFRTVMDQHRMQSLKQYRDYLNSLNNNLMEKEKIKKL